jgi:hypothetical protein
MEAVSNSVHSITDRFGDDTHNKGRILIRVLRNLDDQDIPIIGFEITDNGEGFTDENYASFCTLDSRLKENRGGKGVGRLGWLKVFEHISVDSTFLSGGELRRRGFLFRLTARDQIHETAPLLPDAVPRTTVTFKNFRHQYAGRVPVNPETLQSRVASHFVPLFLAGNAPQIVIDDGGPLINVEAMFAEHIVEQRTDNITITLDDEPYPFEVWSLKCDRSVRFDARGINFVFLAGHKRSVQEFSIDTPLGLRWLDEDNNFYIACVNSPYLDEHGNAERTQFTFDAEHNEDIRRAAEAASRDTHFFARASISRLQRVDRVDEIAGGPTRHGLPHRAIARPTAPAQPRCRSRSASRRSSSDRPGMPGTPPLGGSSGAGWRPGLRASSRSN